MLLVSDRVHHEKFKKNFTERMWMPHQNITTIALLNETPLKRLLTQVIIVPPNICIINIYESE